MKTASMACLLSLWMAAFLLSGCGAIQQASREQTAARIDEAIARYHAEAAQVRPGDSKEKVLALLQPTQFELQSNEIRPPEAVSTQTDSGKDSLIEIYFFRSSRHPDEGGTDRQGFPLPDNFTPYIFTDGVLTGTGWTALLSLNIRKPDLHPGAEPQPLCKQMAPLAGCF